MQLRDLKTGDLFAKAGELITSTYYGNGWYGRPYSGGPWHVPQARNFPVDLVPAMSLRQLLQTTEVETDCRNRLLQAARVLWTLGRREMAVRWFDRLQGLPEATESVSGSGVVLRAWRELEQSGVDVDQVPNFDWLLADKVG